MLVKQLKPIMQTRLNIWIKSQRLTIVFVAVIISSFSWTDGYGQYCDLENYVAGSYLKNRNVAVSESEERCLITEFNKRAFQSPRWLFDARSSYRPDQTFCNYNAYFHLLNQKGRRGSLFKGSDQRWQDGVTAALRHLFESPGNSDQSGNPCYDMVYDYSINQTPEYVFVESHPIRELLLKREGFLYSTLSLTSHCQNTDCISFRGKIVQQAFESMVKSASETVNDSGGNPLQYLISFTAGRTLEGAHEQPSESLFKEWIIDWRRWIHGWTGMDIFQDCTVNGHARLSILKDVEELQGILGSRATGRNQRFKLNEQTLNALVLLLTKYKSHMSDQFSRFEEVLKYENAYLSKNVENYGCQIYGNRYHPLSLPAYLLLKNSIGLERIKIKPDAIQFPEQSIDKQCQYIHSSIIEDKIWRWIQQVQADRKNGVNRPENYYRDLFDFLFVAQGQDNVITHHPCYYAGFPNKGRAIIEETISFLRNRSIPGEYLLILSDIISGFCTQGEESCSATEEKSKFLLVKEIVNLIIENRIQISENRDLCIKLQHQQVNGNSASRQICLGNLSQKKIFKQVVTNWFDHYYTHPFTEQLVNDEGDKTAWLELFEWAFFINDRKYFQLALERMTDKTINPEKLFVYLFIYSLRIQAEQYNEHFSPQNSLFHYLFDKENFVSRNNNSFIVHYSFNYDMRGALGFSRGDDNDNLIKRAPLKVEALIEMQNYLNKNQYTLNQSEGGKTIIGHICNFINDNLISERGASKNWEYFTREQPDELAELIKLTVFNPTLQQNEGTQQGNEILNREKYFNSPSPAEQQIAAHRTLMLQIAQAQADKNNVNDSFYKPFIAVGADLYVDSRKTTFLSKAVNSYLKNRSAKAINQFFKQIYNVAENYEENGSEELLLPFHVFEIEWKRLPARKSRKIETGFINVTLNQYAARNLLYEKYPVPSAKKWFGCNGEDVHCLFEEDSEPVEDEITRKEFSFKILKRPQDLDLVILSTWSYGFPSNFSLLVGITNNARYQEYLRPAPSNPIRLKNFQVLPTLIGRNYLRLDKFGQQFFIENNSGRSSYQKEIRNMKCERRIETSLKNTIELFDGKIFEISTSNKGLKSRPIFEYWQGLKTWYDPVAEKPLFYSNRAGFFESVPLENGALSNADFCL